MKVLFTGQGGNSGTWRMRAVEMASAKADWKVVSNADKHDLQGMDAVVLIKRFTREMLQTIHSWGGPFLYDPLDFWRQPLDDINISSIDDINKVFGKRFKRISPHVFLCTNKVMSKDIAKLGYKTMVHYHHYDPKLKPHINTLPNSILYWGRIQYLGEWEKIIRGLCKKLGKTFLCYAGNATIIGKYNAETMFAVRGGDYGTWLAKRWKSGIKGITAERLGIPFIAMKEQSYIEQSNKNLFPFTNKIDLEEAIVKAFQAKNEKYIRNSSTEYSLKNCAHRLEKNIEEILFYVR